METKEQTVQHHSKDEEEPWVEENKARTWSEDSGEQQTEQEPHDEDRSTMEEAEDPMQENSGSNFSSSNRGFRRNFINGLSVGLGIGCIATFVIMWIAVFFSPLLPAGATYENMLSIFIYPLIYLLAVGLITLTAGIVREYYAVKIPSANTQE